LSIIFKWDESEMQALLESCRIDESTPIIERHFPQGSRLLEAGCGAARWVRFFKDRGYPITGLEFSGDTVAMVKRHWPDLDMVEGDCERSPFPANTFDGVLSFGVVEHWIDGPQAPLQDIFRVLKPGAKTFITVPCFNSVRRLKRALWCDEITKAPKALAGRLIKGKPKPLSRLNRRYAFPVFPAWGEFFEYRMSPEDFRSEIVKAGFEVLEQRPVGAMDGIYHELNPFGLMVGWRDWKLRPRGPARMLNAWLSKQPFAHPHMQAVVARKPANSPK
jgi:SAM-dependent methyltransferase